MQPPLEQFALIASHQDQVVDVPAEARVIAPVRATARSPGLAVGERAWTLQGHPEFVPALADHLLAGRVELIGAERGRRRAVRRSRSRPTATSWRSGSRPRSASAENR